MDCKEAIIAFEHCTQKNVVEIERCGVGIANCVFIVTTASGKFILRCSREKDAYRDTIAWLDRLSECEIPIPTVLWQGKYRDYACLILSYIRGDDIGTIYSRLSDSEKRQIAREVVAIQRKVSQIDMAAGAGWTWNHVIDEMLHRAGERIKRKHFFDAGKVTVVRNLKQEIEEYLDTIQPIPYLDDISTKNLLIYKGKLSGIIDIDWVGLGDLLTFAAMTKVALLNMELDTRYIDYLLEEIHPNTTEYRAFVFYCLMYCVDFMGERGMKFLDKTVPVSSAIIRRLNDIFDVLLGEWNECCEQ